MEISSTIGNTCPICFREFEPRPPPVSLKSNSDGKPVFVETQTVPKHNDDDSETFSTFAILPNCVHTFCMSCILRWRDGHHRRVRNCEVHIKNDTKIHTKIYTKFVQNSQHNRIIISRGCQIGDPFSLLGTRLINRRDGSSRTLMMTTRNTNAQFVVRRRLLLFQLTESFSESIFIVGALKLKSPNWKSDAI